MNRRSVDMAQTEWEIARLYDLVRDHRPHNILEVGVWEGGTLGRWLEIADEQVVGIDDTMRAPGPNEWHRWAKQSGVDLALFQGRSDDATIIDQANERGPYDFAFIDADHTYESVKADWENYRPMVREGGIVAFHDIVDRPGYGVAQLWGEIKSQPGSRTLEIVENSGHFNGIGVVWL